MMLKICLFALSRSFSLKYLFMSFAHFLIGLFVFVQLNLESSLYSLDTSHLSDTWIAGIFS